MDFFAHQKRVKAVSRRLAVLFGATTCLSLAAVYGTVAGLSGALGMAAGLGMGWAPHLGACAAAVSLLIVTVGMWAESRRLGTTGAGLAQRLGARTLDPVDALHRRLREVAEEVAVDAGVPVPALYILDEPSINALASGERPAVAAVIITQGALEQLDRAQLQGVVGHAIARVLDGDAAMSSQLTSALYGLCCVRLAGLYLSDRALDSGLGYDGPALTPSLARLARSCGVALSIIGLPGMWAAQLVRAGIGRQRQFLADAIAVRITGDRDGLGSVLRRIASERIARDEDCRSNPALAGAARVAGERRGRGGYRALVVDFMMIRPSGEGWELDPHGSLAARIGQLYGRPMPPLRRRSSGAHGAAGAQGAHDADAAPRAVQAQSGARSLTSRRFSSAPLFRALFASAGPVRAPSPAAYCPDATIVAENTWGATLVTASAWGAAATARPWSGASAGADPEFCAPAAQFPDDASRLTSEDMRHWSETIAIQGDDRPAGVPLSATPAAALIARLRSATISREEAARWLCTLVTGAIPGASGAENDLRVAAALRWLLSPAGGSMRVPVLELMFARSRRWSSAHRAEMLERCRLVLERHGRIESAEWVHYALARHRLLSGQAGTPGTPVTPGTRDVADSRSATPLSRRSRHSRPLATLFAMAATIGEASARITRDTLAQTAAMLAVQPPAATPDDLDTTQLADALESLVSLPSLDKPILLRMLARMARTPGDPHFEAFIRAVAAAIDCPMPRLSRAAVPDCENKAPLSRDA